MLVLGQQQIVPARLFLRQRAVAAVLGMAGDAREQAFVAVGAEQAQKLARARDDDVVHPGVKGRPGIVAALLIDGERGPVEARKIGVLHVDEEERRAAFGEIGIVGLGRAVRSEERRVGKACAARWWSW